MLKVTVVAAGVETEEQAIMLRSLHCDELEDVGDAVFQAIEK